MSKPFTWLSSWPRCSSRSPSSSQQPTLRQRQTTQVLVQQSQPRMLAFKVWPPCTPAVPFPEMTAHRYSCHTHTHTFVPEYDIAIGLVAAATHSVPSRTPAAPLQQPYTGIFGWDMATLATLAAGSHNDGDEATEQLLKAASTHLMTSMDGLGLEAGCHHAMHRDKSPVLVSNRYCHRVQCLLCVLACLSGLSRICAPTFIQTGGLGSLAARHTISHKCSLCLYDMEGSSLVAPATRRYGRQRAGTDKRWRRTR